MSVASQRIAAFFDVDGTLLAPPSLERRFFDSLRYRRAVPMRNYLLWLARAARLALSGVAMMRHANKMYLRGVNIDGQSKEAHRSEQARRQGPEHAGMSVPRFFPDAIDRLAWHAQQGHAIFLVSGTPAPLAQEVALALMIRLAVRGVAASLAVCATRLEERDGRWTGRILGEAMFGEAKGNAVRRLAAEKGFDLKRCYAYGDGATDRWMLEAVGFPTAVNPSWILRRLARARGWPVIPWWPKKNLIPSSQKTARTQRTPKQLLGPEKAG